ncbi:PIGR protein, partial [Amia calva]|nr:PIGR protein [Amia calva]
MSADRRVTGAEGGRVEIKCPYQDGYQYRVKYWCRDSCGNKDVLIRTGKADTVVTAGRFYLINSVSAKTFTVWMNRLTLQDSGVYYCGVEDWGKDTLTKIHLSVIEGCVQSRRVTGVEGGRVEINCTYEDGYQYYVKYWCREPCENKDVLINSVQADITVTAGRFTLTNYVSAMIFTVWMTRLTLQDAGIYYCGVEKWGKDIYGEIHLIISKGCRWSIRPVRLLETNSCNSRTSTLGPLLRRQLRSTMTLHTPFIHHFSCYHLAGDSRQPSLIFTEVAGVLLLIVVNSSLMNEFLIIHIFHPVLGCVTSADRRVTGAEGGSVEIKCPYQDGSQYRVKYWCHDPCGNKDVLIRNGKADTVVTAGRFNMIDSVSAKTFTVWMNRLTLQDSGVYYCGVEDWGKDTLEKIHLSVSKGRLSLLTGVFELALCDRKLSVTARLLLPLAD